VTASPAAGQKNSAFGKGFGVVHMFLAFVNTAENDTGSGFAFHDNILSGHVFDVRFPERC
jgi:hypothetical protein